MGFEPEETIKEETAENKFEGGGVDLDSGDLSAADPISAPKRTMRERHTVRPRAVSAQKADDRSASADQSRISRRAGAMSPPPIRKPIMRSNSEFGYLFNDSEPMDNHMDEQYSHRLDGLAYDGKGKDSDSQYSDLFDGEQQSMVRRPENRSSAAASAHAAEPAAQPSHRPKFSRRGRETSAASAYAAAAELSAAELAARAESQPQSQPLAEQSAHAAEPAFAGPQPGAMPYPEDNYPPDPYGEYGRRPLDPRGPYDMPPEYPPYGQYPVYPPNYPYPYPYGQYPMYPPYGYPPYGYPPAAYPPGYGYPPQPQEEVRPAESEAVPMDNVPSPPPSFLRQPKAAEPAPVQPEPEPVFPASGDSDEDEFAAVSAFAPASEPAPEDPASIPEPEPAASPSRERSAGSSRFNRRSRSGDSSPAPTENRSHGFGSAAAPVDLFGEDDPVPASKPNAGGGSSRFNRRSRS